MNLTNEQLAEKVQEGKKEFFGEIIDRFEKPLCSYIYKILGDIDNCDDALQETFIKAYININSFNVKRNFSSWIYRIAHNEAISFYRKSVKTLSLDALGDKVVSESDNESTIQKKLETKEQKKLLEKALLVLPLKYREVVVLRFYENKSYEDIAEILRIPTNTVGTYLNRAKRLLKEHFKNLNLEDLI